MKSLLNLALAAALAAPLVLSSQVSSAAPHARVAPLDCRTLVARVGARNVWQARFTGMRRSIGHFKFYERTYAVGCFRTQAACVDWVYWQQSDWPYQNSVGRCRKGMPYGF